MIQTDAVLAVKRLRRQRRLVRARQLNSGPVQWNREVVSSLAVGLALAIGLVGLLPGRAAAPMAAGEDQRGLAYTPDDLRPPLDPVANLPIPMPSTYTVEEGDTLLSIAYKFGSSVDAIQLASSIHDVNFLQIGQWLIIPPARSMLQAVDPGLTPQEAAELYGLQPEVVAAYNAVPLASINEPLNRSVVIVPPEPLDAASSRIASPRGAASPSVPDVEADAPSEITMYTIAEGDTILGIAEKLGVDPDALVAANRLADSHWIVAGDALEVPLWARPARDGESTPPADAAPAAVASADGELHQASVGPPTPIVYEVGPGDTVTALAEKFGVDAETIVATNRLANADRISIGDQLAILPVSGVLYSVEPGDTLAGIAAMFKVDLGPIIDFNYLEDADFISVGMELILPGARPLPVAPARPQTPIAYVVAPGDTVLGIAQRFGVEPDDIVAANRLRSADRISVGDELTIRGGASRRGSQQTVTKNLPVPAPALASAIRPPTGGSNGGLASLALQYSGSRYIYGGTTPAGFDCSGFVYYVHKQGGKPVSRGIWGQYNAGYHPSRTELQPGDIVFFQNTYMPGLSHNGIYVGNGQFIHASDERTGVKISNLSESYWASRWFGATRVG